MDPTGELLQVAAAIVLIAIILVATAKLILNYAEVQDKPFGHHERTDVLYEGVKDLSIVLTEGLPVSKPLDIAFKSGLDTQSGVELIEDIHEAFEDDGDTSG